MNQTELNIPNIINVFFQTNQSQAIPKREGLGRAIRKQFVSLFGGRK